MDSSQEEKQGYIQENLINKGYDSFLFSQFLCKKSGKSEFDLNNFSMAEIREGVAEFIHSTPLGKSVNASAPPLQKVEKKDKKKNILESFLGINNEKKDNKKKEDNNYDYGFRLPEKVKCQNVEETEISRYEDLPIKIGFPEKVDKGFLKKNSNIFYNYSSTIG